MTEFKVGDKVKTLVWKDAIGTPRFPVGTVGIIKSISIENDKDIGIKVKSELGESWWYNQQELELILELTDDYKPTYEDGLNDAWELAKRLAKSSFKELDSLGLSSLTHTLINLSYQDVLYRLESQEKNEKESIQIGDIVSNGFTKVLVSSFSEDRLWFNGIKVTPDDNWGKLGSVCSMIPLKNYFKIGKHVDLDSIYSQIRERK